MNSEERTGRNVARVAGDGDRPAAGLAQGKATCAHRPNLLKKKGPGDGETNPALTTAHDQGDTWGESRSLSQLCKISLFQAFKNDKRRKVFCSGFEKQRR
jgi:hypothetical protein